MLLDTFVKSFNKAHANSLRTFHFTLYAVVFTDDPTFLKLSQHTSLNNWKTSKENANHIETHGTLTTSCTLEQLLIPAKTKLGEGVSLTVTIKVRNF